MVKKILFVLVCAAMMLSISSNTVLAGGGAPPVVVNFHDGETCGMFWLKWQQNGTVPAGTLIKGQTSYVYDPSTGFWTMTCHYFINFDKPNIGTIEEMCVIAEEFFPDQVDCTNSTYVRTGFGCRLLDMVTTDSQEVVSADGHGIATCQFFP